MTIQYARLFQLRAGIDLIAADGPLTRGELADALRRRKDFTAEDKSAEKGAEDIINQLRNANLIREDESGYRLTTDEELETAVDNPILLYAGETIPGAGDARAQADRILANIMYEHPMLLILSKYVYRHAPVKRYELKREFDGHAFLGDKMNSFTIDMGTDLLDDAGTIKSGGPGYVRGRWPVRLFAHAVYEEFRDMAGASGSVQESDLFERLETMYGINRGTFNRLLDRLRENGIVSEGSYEELLLNADQLTGARIHE